MPRHALIFANGEPADGTMVQRTLADAHNPYVIAADGGVRIARLFDMPVHTIIGDMDSLSSDDHDHLKRTGAKFITYPPQKDFTDLELAFMHAIEQGMTWIRVIGGLGDRFDQTLANVYLLTLPILAGCDVAMVAGEQFLRVLSAGTPTLMGQVGDTLSLIPLGAIAEKIRTEGLQYPLNNETLLFGPARGISNVFLSSSVTLHIGVGHLLAIHTNGHA